MKLSPLVLLPAVFLIALSPVFAQDGTTVVPAPAPVAPAPAQTTTTTTTNPDGSKTTQTTVTTAPATPPPAVTETTVTTTTPAKHMAEIEIVLSRGDAQAYFGRAPRGEKLSIGDASISFKLPSTATVTKLAMRDKSSDGADKVTVDNPWHVMVPFNEGGRFVFNISDFDDDAVAAEVLVKVDGVVKFEGHGRDDDFKNWPEAIYGTGVHHTGRREIAFDVD
jgi:hypothetical protein